MLNVAILLLVGYVCGHLLHDKVEIVIKKIKDKL